MVTKAAGRPGPAQIQPTRQSFLLTRAQPALNGLMDGALSTLAPIFAVALATYRPLTAFFAGGIVHTLPFLIPGYGAAISAAIAVAAGELVALAWLRHRFFRTSFARSFVAIAVGDAIIAALSSGLGFAARG
jgi:hypothetical protein